jgi:hypothetical protein
MLSDDLEMLIQWCRWPGSMPAYSSNTILPFRTTITAWQFKLPSISRTDNAASRFGYLGWSNVPDTSSSNYGRRALPNMNTGPRPREISAVRTTSPRFSRA